MRKFMISAALLSAAAMSAPAAAQYGPRVAYGQTAFRGGGLEAQLRELDQRVATGFQRGLLSRGEANRLSGDVRQLQVSVRGKAWNGLSFRERQNLEGRVQALSVRIDNELREGRGQRRDRRW